MQPLSGKIALVTGASRGIGEAIVRELAAAGATVHFTYGSSKEQAETVERAVEHSKAHQLDASQPAEMAGFAKRFIADHGAPDILIHNAGTFSGGMIGEIPLEEFQRVMRINVESVMALTDAMVPSMKEGSRIVITSSVLGERASAPGISSYNASKFAATGLARSWAKDLGERGILVNAVQPGPINTSMNPDSNENEGAEMMKSMTALGRYGTPEEVAAAVAFLVGPGASYITGTTLNVDGGWNA